MTSERYPDFDYESEGLRDDVVGDQAKEARARLPDYLLDEESVTPAELRLAHEERRLFLLPIERALSGVPEFTAAEVAERSGVDL